MKFYFGKLDIWSIAHLLGLGYLLANIGQVWFGINGILCAFIIGVLYEVFESKFYHLGKQRYPSWIPFFRGSEIVDPRGGSISDILCDGLGCLIAIVL